MAISSSKSSLVFIFEKLLSRCQSSQQITVIFRTAIMLYITYKQYSQTIKSLCICTIQFIRSLVTTVTTQSVNLSVPRHTNFFGVNQSRCRKWLSNNKQSYRYIHNYNNYAA